MDSKSKPKNPWAYLQEPPSAPRRPSAFAEASTIALATGCVVAAVAFVFFVGLSIISFFTNKNSGPEGLAIIFVPFVAPPFVGAFVAVITFIVVLPLKAYENSRPQTDAPAKSTDTVLVVAVVAIALAVAGFASLVVLAHRGPPPPRDEAHFILSNYKPPVALVDGETLDIGRPNDPPHKYFEGTTFEIVWLGDGTAEDKVVLKFSHEDAVCARNCDSVGTLLNGSSVARSQNTYRMRIDDETGATWQLQAGSMTKEEAMDFLGRLKLVPNKKFESVVKPLPAATATEAEMTVYQDLRKS